MKSFYIVALALVATCAADTYSPDNDNLDIEAVVADEKTLKAFVNCFVDQGECTALTSDFKKDLPEAVQQACAKCTPAQKRIFKTFLDGLQKKYPADYETFRAKYDPNNKYFAALKEAVSKP